MCKEKSFTSDPRCDSKEMPAGPRACPHAWLVGAGRLWYTMRHHSTGEGGLATECPRDLRHLALCSGGGGGGGARAQLWEAQLQHVAQVAHAQPYLHRPRKLVSRGRPSHPIDSPISLHMRLCAQAPMYAHCNLHMRKLHGQILIQYYSYTLAFGMHACEF